MNKSIAALQIGITILSITFTLALQAAPEGHYRWQDVKGNIHYSDRPPEGVESEFIKFATGKRSKPPAEQNQDTEGENGKTRADGSKAMEVLPQKDPLICKQAQANLKALDGARIRMTDLDGTKRFLTEEEKEDQRVNARKFIKLHCG